MKIVRFLDKKQIRWGRLLDHGHIEIFRREPFAKIELTGRSIPLARVKLLPPACPSKIILIGLNYRDHARELKMPMPQRPLIFLKPNTALIGPDDVITYPKGVRRLDYEAELALVIGTTARFVPGRLADKYVLGYTCLNDVTARDLQKQDIQWTRAKSFDSFCPLGPWLETEIDPANLDIRLYLNNKLKQVSSTANFIFPPAVIISFISQIMTLFPGDVISTGTPSGVGRMKRGDLVEVDIQGIGRLKNRVV